ncbi:MAG: response regulator transcription factor [Planctomycetales bacterium]|nr:response regulator transcription factor [Planctomycetales bacterium]
MNFDAAKTQLDEVSLRTINRSRILIVDDDPDQAECLSYRLEQQGYEPQIAPSCSAALVAAELSCPDLIILDICLPDGDGLSVCEQLNDDTATCEIPVIVLSAMDGPNLVRKARAAGCEYYLRKPYDPNALLALIKNAIGRDDDLSNPLL